MRTRSRIVRRFRRVCTIRLAPIRSSNDSATCITTSIDDRGALERPAVACLSDVPTSTRDVDSAGASPHKNTAVTASAVVNASVRPFGATSIGIGAASLDASTSSTRLPHQARNNPSAPPRLASSALSVRNCLINRPRPAPIASRIATSRWRAVARASSRHETFAHAMSRTTPTTPARIRNGSAKRSRNPGNPWLPSETRIAPNPRVTPDLPESAFMRANETAIAAAA